MTLIKYEQDKGEESSADSLVYKVMNKKSPPVCEWLY